jgi:putative ABC transport system substrate-binding protein
LLFAVCSSSEAQQAKKLHRIGLLVPGSSATFSTRIEALRQGLRDLGYVEGNDVVIEYRYADGQLERLPELAAELIGLNVNLMVAGGNEATAAAKNVTKELPIVMANSGDAVRLGFIASLARPGGNITGLISNPYELPGKRLELIKEIVPKAIWIVVLVNTEGPQSGSFKEAQMAAKELGIKLQFLEVRTPENIEEAFRVVSKDRPDALLVLSGAFTTFHQRRIAELAIKSRLPSAFTNSAAIEAGGLIGYGTDRSDSYRRVAVYVDKILKGAKPADLPVQQPTKFELVINLKTAKQIGLTIPPNVLARADKVIR